MLDTAALDAAMAGQEVVYANLPGNMDKQARAIVASMNRAGVRRLIFISSMGIYDEVPGERHGAILDPYRRSAAATSYSRRSAMFIAPGGSGVVIASMSGHRLPALSQNLRVALSDREASLEKAAASRDLVALLGVIGESVPNPTLTLLSQLEQAGGEFWGWEGENSSRFNDGDLKFRCSGDQVSFQKTGLA